MRPPSPKVAAARARKLMETHATCGSCGMADWIVNEYGDLTCSPCWTKTRAELDAMRKGKR